MSINHKADLRAAHLQRRSEQSAGDAETFAARLARIGPELARAHGASVVSVFSSIGDEVPTLPLIEALHADGFTVGLPVTGRRGTELVFRRWLPDVALIRGRMDIPEPPLDAAVVVPDLLFVPLAAFDRRGHRIGYGAGFYDRTLAALRARGRVVAIGVGFSLQEELFIPAEEHDQPLDFVVTEKDVIVCTDVR